MNRLILRYQYDDTDDFGWLGAEVHTANFSGSGGFFVQWQDVIEFADKVKRYPILPDDPVKEQWGFEMQEGDDLILSIEVAPLNRTGHLEVRVEMADHFDRKHRLRTAFVTNYAEVASFASALSAVMAKSAEEAVLVGKL